MTNASFAANILTMFKTNAKILKEQYDHIQSFDLVEVEDILAGGDGNVDRKKVKAMKYSKTRSHQFDQLVSAIGAYAVDKKKADALTETTYKALWQVKLTARCPYCNKMYQNKLMFQNPTCGKARCELAHMRDSI